MPPAEYHWIERLVYERWRGPLRRAGTYPLATRAAAAEIEAAAKRETDARVARRLARRRRGPAAARARSARGLRPGDPRAAAVADRRRGALVARRPRRALRHRAALTRTRSRTHAGRRRLDLDGAEEAHRGPVAEETEGLVRPRARHRASRGLERALVRREAAHEVVEQGERRGLPARDGRPRSGGGRRRPGSDAGEPVGAAVACPRGGRRGGRRRRGRGRRAAARPPGRAGPAPSRRGRWRRESASVSGGVSGASNTSAHRPLEPREVTAERRPANARGRARTPAGPGRGR